MTCDASATGLSAILSTIEGGKERLVHFAAKALTAAQKNYSQIDKEAAAIIFGIMKFYDYVYGQQFILRTDNQPLVRIFGNNKGIPKMAASRVIR